MGAFLLRVGSKLAITVKKKVEARFDCIVSTLVQGQMLILSVDFQMTKMPAGWGRKEEKGRKQVGGCVVLYSFRRASADGFSPPSKINLNEQV